MRDVQMLNYSSHNLTKFINSTESILEHRCNGSKFDAIVKRYVTAK